jgi:hypothetical protein
MSEATMTLKNRLVKLEEKANPPGPTVIHVYMTGDGFYTRRAPNGEIIERLTQAEYDNLSGDAIKIRVVYDKSESTGESRN